MEPVTKPRVLFVYHTFTKQALKVTEDMERRATGEIRIPPEAESGDYDLVCIGSPTWWLTTCMPIRSYLESDEAGRLLKGKSVAGFVVCRRYWKNNLETVMKLLGTGEYRERYLGIKIPPTNLQPDGDDAARAFAGQLADRLGAASSAQ